MTQYNKLKVNLSNSQLNKLKYQITNSAEVALKLSLNIADDSKDENKFQRNLILTNTQVSKLPKNFANNSSANIKFLKTQLYKIEHSGGFLGRLWEQLLENEVLLRKSVFQPLAKSVLMSLGLTAAASATDASIH